MRTLSIAALVFSSAVAHATTMVPLDLEGLTNSAEAVVSGHVVKTQAQWTSGHDAIYTDVTLNVERVLAGAATVGKPMVVRRAGGSVNGIAMQVAGEPSFNTGDEVVLFVETRGAAKYVVGMAQGKLDVATAATGDKRLSRNLGGVSFTRPLTAAEQTLANIQTVDQLETAVRRLYSARPRK